MNAEVEIKIANVTSINEDAIVNYEAKDFVFISEGNMLFKMLEIKKGSSENNFTEINAIHGEDISKLQFVTKGAYALLMQLKNKSE